MRFTALCGLLAAGWFLCVAPAPTAEAKLLFLIAPRDVLHVHILRPEGSNPEPYYWPADGERMVLPDGTISLGVHGPVAVAGQTPEEAAGSICAALARFREDASERSAAAESPIVIVDVVSANRNMCYVMVSGSLAGAEEVFRLPLDGSETVLEIVAGMLERGACVWPIREMRVVRGCGAEMQTLPVDWRGITQHGMTATNYSIEPGDQVFIRCAGPKDRQVGK